MADQPLPVAEKAAGEAEELHTGDAESEGRLGGMVGGAGDEPARDTEQGHGRRQGAGPEQ